jgi:hypothetical protein
MSSVGNAWLRSGSAQKKITGNQELTSSVFPDKTRRAFDYYPSAESVNPEIELSLV